jgi:ABC-type nickel/cobalt efflux system permease component RcnA
MLVVLNVSIGIGLWVMAMAKICVKIRDFTAI